MNSYREPIEDVLADNRNAFAEIVAMVRDSAMALATSRLSDPTLAEDAVQEAFLAAFVKLPTLRDPDAFTAWFKAILLHCCDRIRARHYREAPGRDQDAALMAAAEEADAQDLVARHRDQAAVRRILAVLPGAAREACIHRYVHGRSCKEIASLLNIPEGTVKRRLHEARRRIVGELQAGNGSAIRVGYLPISDHLLAMVAHARRGLSDPGIALTRYLAWGRLARDLAGGLLDAAFIMVPLAMSLRNQGVPLIYVLDGHHDGSAITVRRDRASRNLAGMRIGLPHAVSTHGIFLHALVGGAPGQGAGPGPPRFLSPSYLGRCFTGRQIDGFFCAEPWHTRMEAAGMGRVLTRSGDFAPGHVCCGLVVHQSFAVHQGQVLRDYVRKLLAAAEYTTRHAEDCADIQARYTRVPKAVARHILDHRYVTFRDLSPDRGRLERTMKMALSSSVLKHTCDLDGFLNPEFA